MTKHVEMVNYTIDGEKAGEFSMRFTLPDTSDIAEQQNIVVNHKNRVYILQFGSILSEFSKSETKEVGERIVKSIKWTR